MKEQIQKALEQAYGAQLGLTDKSVYARVAALGETYVTKEEDIPDFVKKAEAILKSFQGADDKGRTLATANAKITELEAKIKELEGSTHDNGPEPPKSLSNDEIAKLISDAVSNAVKPLQESLDAYKNLNNAKEALNLAKQNFYANKWTTANKIEADNAWKVATALYEAKGSKMSAEELTNLATGYFNTWLSQKGVDGTKPFPSDKDQNATPDFSAAVKHLESKGLIATDDKK